MNMKQVITRQYRENVNEARTKLAGVQTPPEGWLGTMRTALGMTGAQLARRMGVTRGAVSSFEKAELNGGITLKSMQKLAQAMNARFVYAVIPEDDVNTVIERRAQKRAHALVQEAGIQMALEEQSLSSDRLEAEVMRVAKELLEKRQSELWNDN